MSDLRTLVGFIRRNQYSARRRELSCPCGLPTSLYGATVVKRDGERLGVGIHWCAGGVHVFAGMAGLVVKEAANGA